MNSRAYILDPCIQEFVDLKDVDSNKCSATPPPNPTNHYCSDVCLQLFRLNYCLPNTCIKNALFLNSSFLLFRAAERARQAEGLPLERSKARYKKIHTKIPQDTWCSKKLEAFSGRRCPFLSLLLDLKNRDTCCSKKFTE